MKHYLPVFTLTLLLSFNTISAQMKQASTVALANVCNTLLDEWDSEPAIVNFNPDSQQLELTTDVFEVLDNKAVTDTLFEEDENGMPIKLSAHLEIKDLDFKSSADNGQSFNFDTKISCNGKEMTARVTYIFFYAPMVGQRDNSPLIPYRFDFSVSINPAEFGLRAPNGCEEIVLKVQDALLNKVNT